MAKPSEELLARIALVTNKRARFVLDSIVAHGQVTTEDINRAGYDHPPRAAQDVRDLGFAIKTVKVKHSNGRQIAAYVLGDAEFNAAKHGRRLLPKKRRDMLILAANKKCQICNATLNLQVDHRIPFEIAGETEGNADNVFQILCGPCNRQKSWACEHCPNRIEKKSVAECRSCYWASPGSYQHIAMQPERRVQLIWQASDLIDFEQLLALAKKNNLDLGEQVMSILQRYLSK
jgi:hypothetical protein